LLFLITGLCLFSALLIYHLNSANVDKTYQSIEHTHSIISRALAIKAGIPAIESMSRAYALSGNDIFLDTLNPEIARMRVALSEIETKTSDNAIQQQNVLALKSIIDLRIRFIKKIIQTRATTGMLSAAKLVAQGEGRDLTLQINKLVNKVTAEELRLLKKRRDKYEATTRNADYLFISIITIIVGILISVAIMIYTNQKERNRHEAKLNTYMHFFNNTSDVLSILNGEGKFEIVNHTFEKLLGYSIADLLSISLTDLVHEEDAKKMQSILHASSESDQGFSITTRCRTRRGKYVGLDWNITKDPQTNKIYALARDITQRVKLEHELDEKVKFIQKNEIRINEILETLLKFTRFDFTKPVNVGDYDDELAAIGLGLNVLGDEIKSHLEEINFANHSLTSLNKELEGFSYSVSHDLRAPLRAINGYAKIIFEDYHDKLDEEGVDALNTILNNSKKMGELIDALLEFSKLGRKEVIKSELNMTEIVDGVIGELKSDNLNNASIVRKEILPAYGDSTLIKSVWTNLISNALKYSNKTHRSAIEIGSYAENGEMVYFVKDNGAGFDMVYYDKLFGVFQRLHSQEEFAGTGIGLAMVQKILMRHHGKIWAQSKVNEGSTFFFTLPAMNLN
jgi:PAS domain S-box-containing protein